MLWLAAAWSVGAGPAESADSNDISNCIGSAGLRVFDLRDGDAPREVAYCNDGKGQVHSGLFHYDAARGIMLASGREAMPVLVLQPQVIRHWACQGKTAQGRHRRLHAQAADDPQRHHAYQDALEPAT